MRRWSQHDPKPHLSRDHERAALGWLLLICAMLALVAIGVVLISMVIS